MYLGLCTDVAVLVESEKAYLSREGRLFRMERSQLDYLIGLESKSVVSLPEMLAFFVNTYATAEEAVRASRSVHIPSFGP